MTPPSSVPAAAVGGRLALGIACIVGYLVLASGNLVYVSELVQSVDPILLVCCSFALTLGYFQVHTRLLTGSHVPARSGGVLLVLLNGSTLVSWVGYFAALRYVEPAVVSGVIAGMGPVVVIFADRVIRRRAPIYLVDIVIGMGVLIAMLFMVWASLTGNSATGSQLTGGWALPLGVAAAFAAGVGVVGNTIFSKRLSDAGWKASQLMAHRFYLMVGVTVTYVLVSHPVTQTLVVLRENWYAVLAVSIVGVTVPLFLLQLGINRSTPVATHSLLALAPCLTLVLQSFSARLTHSPWSFGPVVAITALIVASVAIQTRRSMIHSPAELALNRSPRGTGQTRADPLIKGEAPADDGDDRRAGADR